MTFLRKCKRILCALGVLALLACAGNPIDALAPGGDLKMGLYKGSPTSILPAIGSTPARGIGYELGQSIATQLGSHYMPIVFEKNADVMTAVRNGEVDLVFTNVSPERAKYILFSKTVIRIEKGFLISPKSKIRSYKEINQSKIRIGFSAGSNSQVELPMLIPKAILVQTSSIKQAIEMLKAGELDAFSTNKAILFEMAPSVSGAIVLPDVIGYENLALGTPINRQNSNQQLNEIVDQLISTGKLNTIIRRSGIQGLAPN